MAIVPNVRRMDDETLIKHMEARHGEMIAEGVRVAPNETARRVRLGVEWRTFHDKMHELYDGRVVDGEPFYNHIHKADDE